MAASKLEAVKQTLTESLLSDQVTPSAARRISDMLKELAHDSVREERLDAMEQELHDMMGNLTGPTVDEIRIRATKGEPGLVQLIKQWFRSRGKPMNWLSRILGRDEGPGDIIIARCRMIAADHELSLGEDEWGRIQAHRDELATSPLRAMFVQKDVFHALCFLCVFDSIFETGIELLQANSYDRAIETLERRRGYFLGRQSCMHWGWLMLGRVI